MARTATKRGTRRAATSKKPSRRARRSCAFISSFGRADQSALHGSDAGADPHRREAPSGRA